MKLEIALGHEVEVVDLSDGLLTVGGSTTDPIHFPGLPAALVRLELRGEQLFATATRALIIGRAVVPPHVRRLVVPGEVVHLAQGGAMLRQVPLPPTAAAQTAGVLKALCRDELQPAASRAPRLTCVTGAEQGVVWVLAERETWLGRAESCPVRLRDRAVSRRALRLLQVGERCFVAPVPRAAQVFLNGRPVQRSTALRGGDVLQAGHSLLRFDAGVAAEATVIVAARKGSAPRPPPPRLPRRRQALPFEWLALAVGVGCAVFGFAVTVALLGAQPL